MSQVLGFCRGYYCELSLLFVGNMDSIYLNVIGPYRIRMYRKEERNSDFFHSSMPGIHSVSLYFGRVGTRFLMLFLFSPGGQKRRTIDLNSFPLKIFLSDNGWGGCRRC